MTLSLIIFKERIQIELIFSGPPPGPYLETTYIGHFRSFLILKLQRLRLQRLRLQRYRLQRLRLQRLRLRLKG